MTPNPDGLSQRTGHDLMGSLCFYVKHKLCVTVKGRFPTFDLVSRFVAGAVQSDAVGRRTALRVRPVPGQHGITACCYQTVSIAPRYRSKAQQQKHNVVHCSKMISALKNRAAGKHWAQVSASKQGLSKDRGDVWEGEKWVEAAGRGGVLILLIGTAVYSL